MSVATLGVSGQQLNFTEVDALPPVESHQLAGFPVRDRAAIFVEMQWLLTRSETPAAMAPVAAQTEIP